MFWLNKAEKGLDNHSAIMTQGDTYKMRSLTP